MSFMAHTQAVLLIRERTPESIVSSVTECTPECDLQRD
jgi:hypothetical protein